MSDPTQNKTTRRSLAHPFAVAGTGKRAAYRNYLRHPRNGSIKRALQSVVDSLRGIAVPPSSWDDLNRSRERNWKRHRRTQWHETAP